MSTHDRLVELILAAEPRCGSVRVVATDGGAAAGKSTLAAQLASALPGSLVLHTDDLLDGWAGQFNFHQRLRDEVLTPLAQGRPGRYRRYDWVTGRFADWLDLPVPETLIVEGVSAIQACAGVLSLGIFIELAREVREHRWILRDGPLEPPWLAWLDAEDRYFAEHSLPAGSVVIRADGFGCL